MQLFIASTSTVYGQSYLQYIAKDIQAFFTGRKNILFVPYARPGGISWNDYTTRAAETFASWGFTVKGAHEFDSAASAVSWAQGVFTGGGNTFLLLKTLYETGLFNWLDEAVRNGLPYMGTSAGSNIAGISIGTTNDMPIVHPPSLRAFGWLPFNLNPHYLDPLPDSTHMGETRETRIAEFHHFNTQPVLGLREGSWLHVEGNSIALKGSHTGRLFKQGQSPQEIGQGSLRDILENL